MTRIGYDCIGANARAVHSQFPDAEVVFIYDTGSADIKWGPDEVNLWPAATKVHIDQGNGSPPVTTATVRDVESGAWSVGQAVLTGNWKVQRPTIYGSRGAIRLAAASGWRGDVWVAWPGWQGTSPPLMPGVNVVAVQNVWGPDYDSSIIFDRYWPYDGPTEEDMIHVQAGPLEHQFIPFPAGTFREVAVFQDYASQQNPSSARVAIHSEANGWHVVTTPLVSNVPTTVAFPHTDTDAVSIHNNDAIMPVGATLA